MGRLKSERPMRTLQAILLALLLPAITIASEVNETYWSYACEMYIYLFDTERIRYKIYSRIDAESSVAGKYTSYLLTEGTLKSIGGSRYSLFSEDTEDDADADFSEPGIITMRSSKRSNAFPVSGAVRDGEHHPVRFSIPLTR